MSTQEQPKTTPVPLPPALRKSIEGHAATDRRGIVAEIIVLLEEAVTAREKRK